jgi:hypothetical protein
VVVTVTVTVVAPLGVTWLGERVQLASALELRPAQLSETA